MPASVAAKLADYDDKRDFAITPEPPPGPRRRKAASNSNGNGFVIQKHFAGRLHFDLRLEIDGVLVSWAVPQGPSLDPSVRRLAVRTEDHPLGYATFEGRIPDGQYGAGRVEIWDRGSFEALSGIAPAAGLEGGHLKFHLHGERLRGGFALVRTAAEKGRRGKASDRWLLIKEKDAAATRSYDPVETFIGPLDEDAPPAPTRPAFTRPQLATEADSPPTGTNWVHEIKYDGYRLQAVKDRSRVQLFTRAGHDWTAKLPGIRRAIAELPRDRLVLDGELVMFDADGNADFAALQAALKSAAPDLAYVVFDILQIGRRKLGHRPWAVRNGELRALLADVAAPLKYAEHVTGDGRAILAAALQLGAEGIVSKHTGRPWRTGRNRHWLKIKGERRDVFVVGGYRPSKARPFASLLLGAREGRRLVYRGRVGTGFSDRTLATLGVELRALETETSPFLAVGDDAARDARWTRPELAVEVAYADVTADGHLRHAKFIGRAERAPRRQRPAAPAIKLTHPDRVLIPATGNGKAGPSQAGVTKADLLDYYQAAAAHLLPHIADRFVSLVRAPDGDLGKAFFQRHAFAGQPDTIETAMNLGRYNRYLAINSADGLAAAAQFAVLELHPWGAKRETLDYPDRLVFDLDPDEALPFITVRAAARLVRDVLAAGALESFALLTGGKGVHVVAPLDETATWDRVGGFARAFARRLAQAKPDLFTASQRKAHRAGRIYVDWQRNRKSATAIAPWSPRARAGAPVACPVTWDELARSPSAAAYDIVRARRRLAALTRDPWAGYGAAAQTVPEL